MCRAAEQAKAESSASSLEKPAAPETVLDQVVSGLDEDDMAAIGEQLFLRFCAWPAIRAGLQTRSGPPKVVLRLPTTSSVLGK